MSDSPSSSPASGKYLPLLRQVIPGLSGSGLENRAANAALLDVGAVADLLSCSTRHVYRLSDAGRMPRPVKLGALVRWRRDEVEEWIVQGCPRWQRKGVGP